MSNGIVYILTNPCLDGWIKIGMTERNDINERLQELNRPSNIPLSYRCYATYEVDDPVTVEKRIHSIIDRIDNSLHAREELESGKIREREFFRISPETAYGIFQDIAVLRNDTESLRPYAPTQEQAEEEEIAESRSKRSNNSFKLLGMSAGDEVHFLFDENIKATVADNKNTLVYENTAYSVTALARKLLSETRGWSSKNPNGWKYFAKDNVNLNDLRARIENSIQEE